LGCGTQHGLKNDESEDKLSVYPNQKWELQPGLRISGREAPKIRRKLTILRIAGISGRLTSTRGFSIVCQIKVYTIYLKYQQNPEENERWQI
jgi:hypothetical protein